MMKTEKQLPPARRFRALITQGGTTRTIYTQALSTRDALSNLSDDRGLKDGPLTIVLRPIETEAA
jgi:hypothetical protein